MPTMQARSARFVAALAALAASAACATDTGTVDDAGVDDAGDAATPFAARVVSFSPGGGAGFGQELMPDVVLGPPQPGASTTEGSTHVVTLGRGGSIVLELGDIVSDGDGVDLLVFENPFQGAAGAYYEPGGVAVSDDGETFTAFSCTPAAAAPNGCAGYGLAYAGVDPTDPDVAGGDAFDLATIGVDQARFVRIVDVGDGPAGGTTTGFDLDAVAIVKR